MRVFREWLAGVQASTRGYSKQNPQKAVTFFHDRCDSEVELSVTDLVVSLVERNSSCFGSVARSEPFELGSTSPVGYAWTGEGVLKFSKGR